MLRKILLLLLFIPFAVFSQILEEDFDDITDLDNKGWQQINLSEPLGTTDWFQGSSDTFSSHEGAADSYIGANYNNSVEFGGIISNWLITPTVEVKDGDRLSFWSRVPDGSIWNDRLEVRMSTDDLVIPSDDVDDVGSFTDVELVINEDMDLSYPEEWTEFEVIVSGIGETPQEVNFAFRYNVDNSSGDESNYIGIDSVVIEEEDNNNEEGCEWTIHLWTFETFADEVTWELREGEDVLLEGGPYEITFEENLSVTAEGPVEVYINTVGENNDNEVNFTLANENGILISETVEGGEEVTFSDFECSDEGEDIADDYCIPALDCSDADMITNVTFSGIDNDSSCSDNGYGNYTDQIAEVVAGETYPISVSVGDGWESESVSVWIDFDNSGTFDEDEFYYIGTGSNEALTNEIDIPEDVEDGEYRMRVRVAAVGSDDATWDLACDTAGQLFGETEDYTVSVGDMGVSDYDKLSFSFYPNPVKNVLNIQTDAEINSVVVYNLLGQKVIESKHIKNGELQVDTLNSDTYIVEIEFVKGQKERFKIVKE